MRWCLLFIMKTRMTIVSSRVLLRNRWLLFRGVFAELFPSIGELSSTLWILPQITPCLLYMLLHFCDFQYFQLVTGNWIVEDRDFNAHKVTFFVNGNSSFMIQDHLSLVWFIVEKFQLSYPVSILVEGVQVIENGGLLLVLQQRPKMGNERLWKLAVNKMVRTFYSILIFFLCCLLRSDAWCWWMK